MYIQIQGNNKFSKEYTFFEGIQFQVYQCEQCAFNGKFQVYFLHDLTVSTVMKIRPLVLKIISSQKAFY
jgi:hypothetical protein